MTRLYSTPEQIVIRAANKRPVLQPRPAIHNDRWEEHIVGEYLTQLNNGRFQWRYLDTIRWQQWSQQLVRLVEFWPIGLMPQRFEVVRNILTGGPAYVITGGLRYFCEPLHRPSDSDPPFHLVTTCFDWMSYPHPVHSPYQNQHDYWLVAYVLLRKYHQYRWNDHHPLDRNGHYETFLDQCPGLHRELELLLPFMPSELVRP